MAITKLRNRGITDDAVTTDKIAPATVASSDIAPATIASSNIAPGAITTTQISPSVTLGTPVVASDPTPLAPLSQTLFFNSTSLKLKYVTDPTYAVFSVSTTANIPYSHQMGNGSGTSTAGVIFGGQGSSSPYNLTNEFDGSTWSSGGSFLNTPSAAYGYGNSGTGTQSDTFTAAYYNNGYKNASYSYDGSSWATETNYPIPLYAICLTGTGRTSALAAGGTAPSYPGNVATASYNGTSWSAETNTPLHISNGSSSSNGGTESAAIIFGIYGTGTGLNPTLFYDGSTWSNNSAPLAIYASAAGFGTQSRAIGAMGAIYGTPGVHTTCEIWNGSSWSNAPQVFPAARDAAVCTSGATTSGVITGGGVPGFQVTSWIVENSQGNVAINLN
jgi:hypothetical protein